MKTITKTEKYSVMKSEGIYRVLNIVGDLVLTVGTDEVADFEADLMGAFGYIMTDKRNAKIDELIEEWVVHASKTNNGETTMYKNFKLTDKNCRVYKSGGEVSHFGGTVTISWNVFLTKPDKDGCYPAFDCTERLGGDVMGRGDDHRYSEFPDAPRAAKVGKSIFKLGTRVLLEDVPPRCIEIIEERLSWL